MKKLFILSAALLIGLGSLIPATAQTTNDEIKTGKLVKRKMEDGADNYIYATFSFKFGGNGPEVQRLCRNNWDLLFGNSATTIDGLDVTMVVDDRRRIKDLGKYEWSQKFHVPRLSAYEEPESEPAVRAEVGHIYLVHTRDTDSNYYALFRVDRLISDESVEISWKLIDPPKRY
jgi:hypothetical protein